MLSVGRSTTYHQWNMEPSKPLHPRYSLRRTATWFMGVGMRVPHQASLCFTHLVCVHWPETSSATSPVFAPQPRQFLPGSPRPLLLCRILYPLRESRVVGQRWNERERCTHRAQLKMTLAQSLFNTSSKLYFEASVNKKALSFWAAGVCYKWNLQTGNAPH